MPIFKITTIYQKLNNENWYMAQGMTKNGQRFQGYGTTHLKAIVDALKDLQLIITI